MSAYMSLMSKFFWYVMKNVFGIVKSEEPVAEAAQAEAQPEVTESEAEEAARKLNLQYEEEPQEEKVPWHERMMNKWNAACYATWRFVTWPVRAFFGLLDTVVGCFLLVVVMVVLFVVAASTGFVWYPLLVIFIAMLWVGRIRMRRANSKVRAWLKKLETFIGGCILVTFLTVITGGCALAFFLFMGVIYLMVRISRRFTKKTSMPVEEAKVEEPKVEEPKVEEPKVEEPKVEEPKAAG